MTDEAQLQDHPRSPGAGAVVAEAMTTSLHTIGSEQKLSRAREVMREHGLRHLPVLEAGKLVGVLSQLDLYDVEGIAGVDSGVDSVARAMVSDICTVAPGELVADVARTLAEYKYGCAIVVDRGHVVGIFTPTDTLGVGAHAWS